MQTTTVTLRTKLYYVGTRRRVSWYVESVDENGIAELSTPGSNARKYASVDSLVEVEAVDA